jgi:serpin B
MPLWLSRVLHRATIHVDEQGTVATAATAAMGTFGGPPPSTPVFRADHPFVFLIRDTHTGNILFVGRLVEPNPAPPEMQKEPLPTRTGGGMGMF